MYTVFDQDEWETVCTSRPCTACEGDYRKCNGRCNGMASMSQVRRPKEEVLRIKAERRLREENDILAKADAIRAARQSA